MLIMETLRYTCIQISPVWFVTLRSEKQLYGKVPEAFFFMGTLCTKFHLHVLNYVCGFEKSRGSHGENCLSPYFSCHCHGNSVIHMCTKHCLHPFYGVQV